MTDDALIKHRLEKLEEIGVGARETERRVDGLSISLGAIEKTVIETQTEMRQRDERTHASLARLHQRLDDITTAESFEKGREAGAKASQTRVGKVVLGTVMATIAFGAFVVGLLTLVLH